MARWYPFIPVYVQKYSQPHSATDRKLAAVKIHPNDKGRDLRQKIAEGERVRALCETYDWTRARLESRVNLLGRGTCCRDLLAIETVRAAGHFGPVA